MREARFDYELGSDVGGDSLQRRLQTFFRTLGEEVLDARKIELTPVARDQVAAAFSNELVRWTGFLNHPSMMLSAIVHIHDVLRDGGFYQCADCGYVARSGDMAEAIDIFKRMEPGDTYTDKECVECGALAFPIKEFKGAD